MFEVLGYLTIGLIPGLIIVDWAIRGRKHDSTRFWRVRATLVTIATFYIAGYVAVFWGTILGDFHLIDGSGLGTWGGALVGILVYELAALLVSPCCARSSTGCGSPATRCTTVPRAWMRSAPTICTRWTRSMFTTLVESSCSSRCSA